MSQSTDLEPQVKAFAEAYARVRSEIGRVIVGQEEAVQGVLTALWAGGHVLLEGLPGLGKTRLVRTLAQALDLKFGRIQFTPDLMPADIVGTQILRETGGGQRIFEFQRGPVFNHVLLTDEINRATPKTQSALLEAMQEGTVTTGGTTHRLDEPFFVLATQNPIELEGTYPLPEAQLDRFLLKLFMTQGDQAQLVAILDRTTGTIPEEPRKVLTREEVLRMRRLVEQVPVARPVLEYAAGLVLATHPDHSKASASTRKYVKFGASPRGAQALVVSAKVLALAQGRYHVSIEDLRKLARPALRHRMILNYEGEASGVTADRILDEILAGAAPS